MGNLNLKNTKSTSDFNEPIANGTIEGIITLNAANKVSAISATIKDANGAQVATFSTSNLMFNQSTDADVAGCAKALLEIITKAEGGTK